MIEPMMKVSIVLLNKGKEESLKNLRKVGLVHLERLEGSSEKLNAFKEITSNTILDESLLSEIKLPKQKKGSDPVDKLSNDEIVNLAGEIVAKYDRKKTLTEEITNDRNELERFVDWGEVNLKDFEYLAEKGIQLKMYEIPSEKYPLIDSAIETVLVNEDKKTRRFLILNGGQGRPENLLPDAFEVSFPRMSTCDLENEIIKDSEEIEAIEEFYYKKAKYLPQIVAYRKALEADIEFENVNAGMEHESEGQETDLAWVSGYVPKAEIENFKKACQENNWALAYEDADREDSEVPTKLKNNKFVSLVYPLTDFLGTVPGYNEYDISGWFLLFFSIFFGMIFGDGGYGLLVTIVALILMIKNKAAKKASSPFIGLMLLLGLSTVVWGTVTCTWFGIDPSLLPEWLTKASIPLISGAYTDVIWQPFWVKGSDFGLTKDQNLQIFCFALALLQLSIAHIKATKRNFQEKHGVKALGDIGSLMQLIGMLWMVLSMVVNSQVFPMLGNIGNVPIGKIEVSLIAVGFVLSFVFSNYEGSVGKSILESCKNIISVLLGVVNVFSDIVSYIRLWAVGLAGAAISNTVNTLAGPILGHAILFLAAVLLLGFGHGLNMILNLLSVIVHGVRLNTLEFSQHLGVSWSGKKYQPFSEK